MVPLPALRQQSAPAPAVNQLASTVAQLSAEAKALELRIAEKVAASKTLLARLTGGPPESRMTAAERAEYSTLEVAFRKLNTDIATDQAQLELLKVRLSQAVESHATEFPQQPIVVSPGGTIEAPRFPPPPVDRDAEILGIIVAAFVLIPLAIGMAYRLVRRGGSSANARELAEYNERMRRLETSVDTIAVEIERMSENQRFLTRALTGTPTPLPAQRERNAEYPTPV